MPGKRVIGSADPMFPVIELMLAALVLPLLLRVSVTALAEVLSIVPTLIRAVGLTAAWPSVRLSVIVMPLIVSEAIVRGFQKQGSIENETILLARAEVTRDVLAKELAAMGAIVDEAIAYRTLPETEDVSGAIARFREEGADLITFTSSSTVENFLALKLPWPAGLKTAAIIWPASRGS